MNILFVCTGNICRSPLAQGVFMQLSKEAGMESSFEVESAGTAAGWHRGENVDERMEKVSRRHGLILDHLSRELRRADFQYYDYIFAMGREHIVKMRAMMKETCRAHIVLFRDYDPEGSGDVPDPYYQGMDGFEEVYRIVLRSCKQILHTLQ